MKLEDISWTQIWNILKKSTFDELEDVVIDLGVYPNFNTKDKYLIEINTEYIRLLEKEAYHSIKFFKFKILNSLGKIKIDLDFINTLDLDTEYGARDLVFKLSDERSKKLREALDFYERGK